MDCPVANQQDLQHIGFIVDGNRRWAKLRDKPINAGHRQGSEQLKQVVKHCSKLGIPYVSAYTFSTENWNRTRQEVGALMDLFVEFAERDMDEMNDDNIRVVHIGSRDNVPDRVLEALDRVVDKTKDNDGLAFGFCFNYGGHQEITDAVKTLVEDQVEPAEIDIDSIASRLYAPDFPGIDLLVRTSGEQRLSNFMLWRASYAELYFTDTYWPDFDETGVDAALAWYAERQRRFGSG